jgi:hypothetical protein
MTPEEIQAMVERDERFVAGEPDYRAHFDWAERLSPSEREVYRRLLEQQSGLTFPLRLSPALWNLLQTTAQVWRD